MTVLTLYETPCGCEIRDPPAAARRFIRDSLTVAPLPTPHVPHPFRFAVYKEDQAANTFWVPLQWARDAFGLTSRFPARFVKARPPGTSTECRFAGVLRAGQQKAVDGTIACLTQRGGGILSLPTGAGKTACALYISTHFKAKTLVIVHKQLLADQWKQRIRTFVPGASVSVIQGNTCDVSGDFVVAMLQTLVSRAYPPELFKTIRLLVFDEAHHVAAPAFLKSMWSLQVPLTLGLTATPTRKDGLQNVLHWMLGPMAYQESMKNRSDVTVVVRSYGSDAYKTTEPPINPRTGTVDSAAVISRLVDDSARSQMIADIVVEMEPHRQILVLSHRRAHCEMLYNLLQARGCEVGLCIGSRRETTRRILVATYALVAEGFDEPRLDTLVLATPASDVTQAVGRIMRTETSEPLIVDIVDAWGPCWAQASKRKMLYKSNGFSTA
jgi:hypothetical protein